SENEAVPHHTTLKLSLPGSQSRQSLTDDNDLSEHVLAQCFLSSFPVFEKTLRQHLRIAWNLQLGHSWLLISNILTKYRLKRDKGYIPFLEAVVVPNLRDTARELARMLSDTCHRINLTRLFHRRAIEGTVSEKDQHAEHAHMQLVLDRVTRLCARLKRSDRLIEGINYYDPHTVVTAAHLRKLATLFRDIYAYRESYSNQLQFGTPRYDDYELPPLSPRHTSIQVYVSRVVTNDGRMNAGQQTPLRPGWKRCQFLVYCNKPSFFFESCIGEAVVTASYESLYRPSYSTDVEFNKSGLIPAFIDRRTSRLRRFSNVTVGEDEGKRYTSDTRVDCCNTYELEDKCTSIKRVEPPTSTYCSSCSTEFSVFLRPKAMKLSYIDNNDADGETPAITTTLRVPSIQSIGEPNGELESLTGTVELRERSVVSSCSPESHPTLQCTANDELCSDSSSSRDTVNENHVSCLSSHNSKAVTFFQASATSIAEHTPNASSASHALLGGEPIESDLVLHTDGDYVDSKPPSIFDRKADQGMTNARHKTTLEPIIENDFSEHSLKSFNANTVLSDPVKFISLPQTDSNPISKTSQLTTKPVAAPNDAVKGDTCHAVVNSVCELESTIDWVSTQLDAVLELSAETEHQSVDHTRIPTQLACIQQLIQTMAPLGGQIRELKQTLNASELPVCNGLVDSGGPNARVEVVDESTTPQVTIDGRDDESLRNHLRDRLELIRSLRSEKLSQCEQIVCDLEDMHNTYSTLREQLQCIQDKLALVSTQLHDPAGTLWGVQLNDGNGLNEQIESHAALERELDYNLRHMLYEIEKLASKNHMTSLQEQTADVLLELNDLTFVCQQRQNCLSRLDDHLEQIGLLVKEKLSWMEEEIRQLNDLKDTLKDVNSERLGQSARSLLETANRIQMRQPEVQELMKHLDALTSSDSTTSIFSELGVKGPVRNAARFEGWHAELLQVWNEMTTDVLLNVTTELITSAVNYVHSTCEEAIQFTKSQNVRVWFNSDVLLNADYLRSRFQNIQDHIQTIDESRNWMTNEIEPLVCSHIGVSLMLSTSIFNLESLHHCLMHAHTTLCALRDDVSMTYLPAVSALHERLQSASTFMDLLRLQTAQLPVPPVDTISISDENSHSTGDIPLLLALTTNLDLAKVQRAQCQQLIDGIYRERRSLSEELKEIFGPVKKKYKEQECDSLVENLNGTQVTFAEVSNLTGGTAGGPEHNLIMDDPEFAAKKIFDGYNTLLSQLDARKQQFDAAIKALSIKCADLEQVPSVPTVYSLHDSQPLDFGRWESDSGVPFDEADSHGGPKTQEEHFDMPIFECQDILTSPVNKHRVNCQRTVYASVSVAQSESQDTIVVRGLPETHTLPPFYVTEETTRDRAGRLVDMNLLLRKAESKLNRIKHRFQQLTRALIVTPVKERAEEPCAQVFTECASRLRPTLSGIKGLLRGLNNLIHTIQIEDTFEHTNQMQSYLSDHTASSREHEESRPLAYNCYRRDTIISDASLLVEELRESESLVLSAYELSERTAARILRLEPWVAAHLDKLEQLERNDGSTVEALSTALVTISAIKIELRSRLDTVKSVALESALLNSTLQDLRKIAKLDDAMQSSRSTDFAHIVPFCESQASLSNRAELQSGITVNSTTLKEMYSHLLEQSMKITVSLSF
ncbi:hypothetical protein PHET_07560, partial [Paragonimus heterotremus]